LAPDMKLSQWWELGREGVCLDGSCRTTQLIS
jgi:hypothetical protein